MPQPIPSYLFAIAAANLVFRELGPRTGIYAEPEIIDAAEVIEEGWAVNMATEPVEAELVLSDPKM